MVNQYFVNLEENEGRTITKIEEPDLYQYFFDLLEEDEYIGSSNYCISDFVTLDEEDEIIEIENCIQDYITVCGNCGCVVDTDTTYYQDGSSEGYTNTIDIFDLNCSMDIDFMGQEVYGTISSLYDDNTFCDDCLSDLLEEIGNCIDSIEGNLNSYIERIRHHYHYSKDKIRNLAKSNITLGFEIEREYSPEIDNNSYYQEILKDCEDTVFYFEKDGSLDEVYGMEAVTNIIDMEYLWENEEILKDFFSIPTNNTSFCGGHTHIGRNFIENPDNIRDFFIENTEALKAISGRSIFEYCKFDSLHKYERDKFTAVFLKDETLEFRFWGAYNKWETMIRRALITISIVQLSNEGKLNLQNLYNTIEGFNTVYRPKGISFRWYLNKLSVYL